jgi:hypothetical protein
MSDVDDEFVSSGSDSDSEDLFSGWSLDDHIKQMGSLQREFQKLKRL